MSRPDHARTMGGALGWSVAARVARLALGMVGTFLVLRLLGSYEYGVLAVVRNTLAFGVMLVGAGLGQGLLRYLPAWRMQGDRRRFRKALLATLAVHFLLWGVLLLLTWLLRPIITGWTNPVVAGLLILGVLLILPEVVGQTATQIANAAYDTRTLSLAVFTSTLVYLATVAALLWRHAGVAEVLVASAASNLTLAAILWSRVPSYLPKAGARAHAGDGPSPPFSRAFRYSIPFVAMGILNLITWRQSEVLFLGHFHGAEMAGFFDLAYRLPQTILEFVPGAIWPLVMAGSAEIYTRDSGALQRTTAGYYKLLFLLVAPISVGGVLVGDLAIRVLGGADYVQAGVFCQVFFAIFSVSFFATPLSMALYVLERPWVGFVLYLVNATVNVALDLLLIPRYGLWGAVVPVGLVIAMSPFVNYWVLTRLGVRIAIPWPFLSRIYGASLAMLLLWPLRSVWHGPWGLLGLVACGVPVFLLGVRLFRVFGREERELIERASPAAWNMLGRFLAPAGSRGEN